MVQTTIPYVSTLQLIECFNLVRQVTLIFL